MKSLAILALLLMCPVVRAQNQQSSIGSKIQYQRDLPRAVSKIMPKGAKSSFFGKFRFQEKGKQYALNLFKINSKQKAIYGDSTDIQHFTLDIFRIESKNQYRSINRIPFDYGSFTRDHSKFGCQWFWMDANKAKIPVLQFKIWDSKGDDFPSMGDDVFSSFYEGLTHRPTIQSFTSGRWIASDAGGEDNFVNRNVSGIAEITARIYDTNAFKEPTDSKFKWSGKRFEPIAPLTEQQKRFFHWDN